VICCSTLFQLFFPGRPVHGLCSFSASGFRSFPAFSPDNVVFIPSSDGPFVTTTLPRPRPTRVCVNPPSLSPHQPTLPIPPPPPNYWLLNYGTGPLEIVFRDFLYGWIFLYAAYIPPFRTHKVSLLHPPDAYFREDSDRNSSSGALSALNGISPSQRRIPRPRLVQIKANSLPEITFTKKLAPLESPPV